MVTESRRQGYLAVVLHVHELAFAQTAYHFFKFVLAHPHAHERHTERIEVGLYRHLYRCAVYAAVYFRCGIFLRACLWSKSHAFGIMYHGKSEVAKHKVLLFLVYKKEILRFHVKMYETTLMAEVREYDPLMALDGGEDGLHFYREIIRDAGTYLYPGGMLFFEIGCEQAAEVSGYMREAGYKEVTVCKDLSGLDRVVSGIYGG